MIDRRTFLHGALAAAGAWTTGWSVRAEGAPGAVVTTTHGKVKGLLVDRVHAFKHVPYGASTAGARRFLTAD